MGFADSIKASSNKMLHSANDAIVDIATQTFLDTVYFTPSPINPGRYATGLLSNQWYPTFGSMSSEISSSTSTSGSDSLSRIDNLFGSKEFVGKDNVVFLTNNVGWGYRAEYLGWPAGEGTATWNWSGRVGAYGMVSRAMNIAAGKYK